MVAILLDTTIIVDLLRNYPPAERWIKQQTDVAVSATVWLEIINGALNLTNQRKASKMLKDFARIDPISTDYDWAIARTLQYKLSHNIGANGCLIAAVSYCLQILLFTGNIKHFTLILGGLVQKPY